MFETLSGSVDGRSKLLGEQQNKFAAEEKKNSY